MAAFHHAASEWGIRRAEGIGLDPDLGDNEPGIGDDVLVGMLDAVQERAFLLPELLAHCADRLGHLPIHLRADAIGLLQPITTYLESKANEHGHRRMMRRSQSQFESSSTACGISG